MSLMLAATATMSLLAVALAFARARRAAATGAVNVHVHPARSVGQAGARMAGIAVLVVGGLAVQLVETRYAPLSRPALLALAAPSALVLALPVAVWLGRRGLLATAGVYALAGVPLLVYALAAWLNGALDDSPPVTERVRVVDRDRLPEKNNGLRHVVWVTREGAAAPLALDVDETTWAALVPGRTEAVLETRRGRLGVSWIESGALSPAAARG